MRIWGKLAVAAAAPLLLTGCLWGPGKFTSTLALNKAGTFVLDYRGEIMLQMPDEKTAPGPWSNDLAVCHKDGSSEASSGLASVALEPPSTAESDMSGDGSEERPCSAAEIAKLKTEYEKQAAEALQAATIVPARMVGADKRTGSIAVGKEADVVLVDGDVANDLGALRRVVTVVSDGYVMDGDELRKEAGFSGRPK